MAGLVISAKGWKKLKCLSTDECTNNMWCVFAMEK